MNKVAMKQDKNAKMCVQRHSQLNGRRRFQFSIILLLVGLLSANAQPAHEFSLYGMGGFSSLGYKAAQSTVSGGFGGGFGLGYTYGITPQWGVTTGVELSFLRATAKSDRLSGSVKGAYVYAGAPAEDLYLHSVFSGYEERQRANFLNIPLMARFTHSLSGASLYAGAGLKLGFVLSDGYDATTSSLTRTLELTVPGVTLEGENPAHAIGVLSHPALPSGSLSLGMNVALSVEAGMKWRLGEGLGLSAGLYADYGMRNIAPTPAGALLKTDPNAAESAPTSGNSLLSAQNLDAAYVNKVHPLSVGAKIAVSYEF
jgi:hypothetical protein